MDRDDLTAREGCLVSQCNDLLQLVHQFASKELTVPQNGQALAFGSPALNPQYGQGVFSEYFPHFSQNGMFRNSKPCTSSEAHKARSRFPRTTSPDPAAPTSGVQERAPAFRFMESASALTSQSTAYPPETVKHRKPLLILYISV